jgi:6-phosphogluconolactonase
MSGLSESTQLPAYVNHGANTILRLSVETKTGVLTPLGVACKCANPSFFTVHPTRNLLFAVSQLSTYRAENTGVISVFVIEEDSQLSLLDTAPSGGSQPCFLCLDATARHLLVANYMGGSVSVLHIGKDGRFRPGITCVQHNGRGISNSRQYKPFVHCVTMSPDNRFCIASDLGQDKLFIYCFDPEAGSLVPHQPASFQLGPGAGPRQLVFHPTGVFAYALNELDSTITALAWDVQRGAFQELQTVSTLPEHFSRQNLAAAIKVHPSGRFLYASNRGHNSIAAFRIHSPTGTLSLIEYVDSGGDRPWDLDIDSAGSYLLAANRSGSLVPFRIGLEDGKLSRIGLPLEIESPVCVCLLEITQRRLGGHRVDRSRDATPAAL